MNLSYRIFYVWKRNVVSYKRFIVPTFLASLGEPLFYLITFGIGMGAYIGVLGGKPYIDFLIPGIMVTAVMMAATFECLYGTYVKVVLEKVYDSLISTPASAEDVVSGDIAWGVTRGIISGTLLLIVAVLLGTMTLSVTKVILLVGLMIFVGFLFSSLATIITAFAPNFDFFEYYSELLVTPMLFFSGVFFPLDNFPGWVKALSQFLPLTHAVNLSRAVFSWHYSEGLVFSFLYILIFESITFILALMFMKRRLIK